MRFHCSLSDNESTREAIAEVVADARTATGGKVDAVFAFFTGHHNPDADHLLESLWLGLDPEALIGCSAEGVLGGDREIEREPAIAVLCAELPGVRIHPFHIAGRANWQSILSDPDELKNRLGIGPETRAVIGMGDPFSTPLDQFLPAVDAVGQGLPLIGGMASAARAPGQNVLLRNDQALNEGFVGMSLSGSLRVNTIVSQGCRPIGRPLVVTRSRENVIEQLGGKKALEALQEAVGELPEQDRELLQNGLLLGRAISEYREKFERGDFLVRNVIGADQESGAIAVADFMKTGQTVQFHVRDAATASEDLALLLDAQRRETPAAGGLLFSCNGRGTNLFSEPCHDISAARRAMPATPFAGFFAAGELGPVGNRNFVHGHTASMALFRASES